jgi:hypothetical protein
VVKLFVGEEKIFTTSTRKHSGSWKFFVKCSMGFDDGKSRHVHFPKDRPVAFKCFLEWFYLDDASVLSEKDSIME